MTILVDENWLIGIFVALGVPGIGFLIKLLVDVGNSKHRLEVLEENVSRIFTRLDKILDSETDVKILKSRVDHLEKERNGR